MDHAIIMPLRAHLPEDTAQKRRRDIREAEPNQDSAAPHLRHFHIGKLSAAAVRFALPLVRVVAVQQAIQLNSCHLIQVARQLRILQAGQQEEIDSPSSRSSMNQGIRV